MWLAFSDGYHSGDDLLPHDEGVPIGVASRIRRVFKFDADTIAAFQKGKVNNISLLISPSPLSLASRESTFALI